MTPYIDLNRRFQELTDDELPDAESLAAYIDYDFDSDEGWVDLLKRRRVVILAEAGSGKTWELKEQARKLAEAGEAAFFLPLEELATSSLQELLSPSDRQALEFWEQNSVSTAWFFLDAVDELKLKQGSLNAAFRKVARVLGDNVNRARIFVTCRPSDWRGQSDKQKFLEYLPLPPQEDRHFSLVSDELFRQVIGSESRDSYLQTDTAENAELGYWACALLPFSNKQIEQFAVHHGVKNPEKFLAEVNGQNAWQFVRRPLDLAELAAHWVSHGQLGSRESQYELNVRLKLRDDPERPDQGLLSDEKAREGAERLALALALTRGRTIQTPELSVDCPTAAGDLPPAEVLFDWSMDEVKCLLRQAIFDPATYGKVRFHHRSVQEYLAAQRLRTLKHKGMTTAALFRLFFAEKYGVEVVLPSVREVATWLALWEPSVFSEMIKREPEALLLSGDPGSLELGDQKKLITAFVEFYGGGGDRNIELKLDELGRLACPDLEGHILGHWGDGPTNPDVREFLLKLIWLGPIPGCAEVAREAAEVHGLDSYQQIIAVRALLSMKEYGYAREIAESYLGQPDIWDKRVVHGTIRDLFPRVISAQELVHILESYLDTPNMAGNVDWNLRQIAKEIDVGLDEAANLRRQLSNLIWRGSAGHQQSFHDIQSSYGHFAPALAELCHRQIESKTPDDLQFLRDCVVSSRFTHGSSGKDATTALREYLSNRDEWRGPIFWAELDVMDELIPEKEAHGRYFQANYYGSGGHLELRDIPWLEKGLSDDENPGRHAVALHALLSLCTEMAPVDGLNYEVIRNHIEGNAELEEIYQSKTAPRELDPELQQLEEQLKESSRERDAKEEDRINSWDQWRANVIENPDEAFSSEQLESTTFTLYKFLAKAGDRHNRCDVWDRGLLERTFSKDIAALAEEAFKLYWRNNPLPWWSEVTAKERNQIQYSWLIGLTGVSAESYTADWAANLNDEEAALACRYACRELNGLAGFTSGLVEDKPEVVLNQIGGEFLAQFQLAGEEEYPSILQDIAHEGIEIKALFVPLIIEAVESIPVTVDPEQGERWARQLRRFLTVLSSVASGGECQRLLDLCKTRFSAEAPLDCTGFAWLKGVFLFDIEAGVDLFEQTLTVLPDEDAVKFSIGVFAFIFSDEGPVSLDVGEASAETQLISRLLRLAYQYIRKEDDQVHSGVYSPNARDDAESARNSLFSRMLEMPGEEAWRALLLLAEDPSFSHIPDRLLLEARRRAATDADGIAYNIPSVVALERRHEIPPHDRDGMFQVMMDRLEDLAHDMAHHDFNIRGPLAKIDDEIDMQRAVAMFLKNMANGAYTVSREEEVADRKEPDIRLLSVTGNDKAALEIKLAENWTVKQLERAVEHQLLGQYLRHDDCRAGCLLLTYGRKAGKGGTGKSHWIDPETKEKMGFSVLVEHVRDKARKLEADQFGRVRITVFGLDLTDPELVPAHG